MDENLLELRPRMMAVAYRMLGSVADAEDAVQDAFLRLQIADDVTSPEGFLVTVTTRRCIDRLRTRRRRERHLGPNCPDPAKANASRHSKAHTESLSQAFLLMLQRLSPSERAAYLLRTVFEYAYSEIAEVLDKAENHVRQIYRRANSRLLKSKTRFEPASEEADKLAERFVIACRLGDVNAIEQLFAEDVEVYADCGVNASAAPQSLVSVTRPPDSWQEPSAASARAPHVRHSRPWQSGSGVCFRGRRRPTHVAAN